MSWSVSRILIFFVTLFFIWLIYFIYSLRLQAWNSALRVAPKSSGLRWVNHEFHELEFQSFIKVIINNKTQKHFRTTFPKNTIKSLNLTRMKRLKTKKRTSQLSTVDVKITWMWPHIWLVGQKEIQWRLHQVHINTTSKLHYLQCCRRALKPSMDQSDT